MSRRGAAIVSRDPCTAARGAGGGADHRCQAGEKRPTRCVKRVEGVPAIAPARREAAPRPQLRLDSRGTMSRARTRARLQSRACKTA